MGAVVRRAKLALTAGLDQEVVDFLTGMMFVTFL
jgi:hypothetical protein